MSQNGDKYILLVHHVTDYSSANTFRKQLGGEKAFCLSLSLFGECHHWKTGWRFEKNKIITKYWLIDTASRLLYRKFKARLKYKWALSGDRINQVSSQLSSLCRLQMFASQNKSLSSLAYTSFNLTNHSKPRLPQTLISWLYGELIFDICTAKQGYLYSTRMLSDLIAWENASWQSCRIACLSEGFLSQHVVCHCSSTKKTKAANTNV